MGGLSLSDFKTCYVATVIKTGDTGRGTHTEVTGAQQRTQNYRHTNCPTDF